MGDGDGGKRLDWNSDVHYPQWRGCNLNFDGCGPGGGGGSKKWSYIVDVINGWPFNTNL